MQVYLTSIIKEMLNSHAMYLLIGLFHTQNKVLLSGQTASERLFVCDTAHHISHTDICDKIIVANKLMFTDLLVDLSM